MGKPIPIKGFDYRPFLFDFQTESEYRYWYSNKVADAIKDLISTNRYVTYGDVDGLVNRMINNA